MSQKNISDIFSCNLSKRFETQYIFATDLFLVIKLGMKLYVFYAFSGPGGPMQYSKRLGVCVCVCACADVCGFELCNFALNI